MHSALTLSGQVFPSFLSRVPFRHQELSRAENSEFRPANRAARRPSLQMQPSVSIWFRKLGGVLAVGPEPCRPLQLTPAAASPDTVSLPSETRGSQEEAHVCPRCADYGELGDSQDHSCHPTGKGLWGPNCSLWLGGSERCASALRQQEPPPPPTQLHRTRAFAAHLCAFARSQPRSRHSARDLSSGPPPAPC